MLYFFLAAVSDQDGLSFYSDTSIAPRLRMGEQARSPRSLPHRR